MSLKETHSAVRILLTFTEVSMLLHLSLFLCFLFWVKVSIWI